jgi:hypothetical protein
MTDLILGNPIGELSKKRAREDCHSLGLRLRSSPIAACQKVSFFTASQRYAFRKSLTIPPDVAMFLVGMGSVKGGGIGSFNAEKP